MKNNLLEVFAIIAVVATASIIMCNNGRNNNDSKTININKNNYEVEGFADNLITKYPNYGYRRRRFYNNLWENSEPTQAPVIHRGDQPCGVIKSLSSGTAVVNSDNARFMNAVDWTITTDIKINVDRIGYLYPFLRKVKKGIVEPTAGSPVMMFDPMQNTITLFLKNEFDSNFFLTVPLTESMLNNWITLTWVQERSIAMIYINGELISFGTMGNALPVIHLGPLLLESGDSQIEFRNFRLCDAAQNAITVNYYVENKR